MPGLDDAGVHRTHRDFVHAVALDANEGVVGGQRAGGSSASFAPRAAAAQPADHRPWSSQARCHGALGLQARQVGIARCIRPAHGKVPRQVREPRSAASSGRSSQTSPPPAHTLRRPPWRCRAARRSTPQSATRRPPASATRACRGAPGRAVDRARARSASGAGRRRSSRSEVGQSSFDQVPSMARGLVIPGVQIGRDVQAQHQPEPEVNEDRNQRRRVRQRLQRWSRRRPSVARG